MKAYLEAQIRSWHIFAVLALLILLTSPASAHDKKPPPDPTVVERPRDSWSGSDKRLHFGASALAGVACSAAIVRTTEFWPAFGCAMVPGLVKEATDAATPGNRWSWRDMGANALGAAVGVHVGRCLYTGRGFVCSFDF